MSKMRTRTGDDTPFSIQREQGASFSSPDAKLRIDGLPDFYYTEPTSDRTEPETHEATHQPSRWMAQIRDLGGLDYILNEPVMIVLEQLGAEDLISARYPEMELYGEGCSESEAILNLKAEFRYLFDDLTGEGEEALGDMLLVWRRTLMGLIQRV